MVASTAVAIALGLTVTTFVTRRRPRHLRTMQMVAAAVVVVSLAQPLSVETDGATRITLVAMRLVTGAVFVWALRRTRPATVDLAPRPTGTAGTAA